MSCCARPGLPITQKNKQHRCTFWHVFGKHMIQCAETFWDSSRTVRYCLYHRSVKQANRQRKGRLRRNQGK